MRLLVEAPDGSVIPAGHADAFDDRGAQLAALLDMSTEAPVLLVGADGHPQLRELGRGFERSARYPDATAALRAEGGREGAYDLIVWAPETQADAIGMEPSLTALHHLLSPSGTLLLLVRNRLALRGVRAQPSRLWNGSDRTRGQYRALVRSAGFASIREFLPFPSAEAPEEMVSAGARLALPGHTSHVERGLNGIGLLPRFHDSFAYLLSHREAGLDRTVRRLGDALASDGRARPALRLERFALRPRGALILCLADATGSRLLCRVAGSPDVDAVVCRNMHWTERLHASSSLPRAMKTLVPAPIARLDWGERRAYVEELLPGVVAWKVTSRAQSERKLFAQAYAFLRALGIATTEARHLPEEAVQALLPPPRQAWFDAEFADLASELRTRLVRRFAGDPRSFAVSHGDFGYGNLLAEGGRGITGVFDWDQARVDLEGVDLVNFLIQRHRMQARATLPAAVRAVGERVITQGFRSVDARIDFEARVPHDQARRAELMAWSIWRYVERDAGYRREYEARREDLSACLRWAIGAVPR